MGYGIAGNSKPNGRGDPCSFDFPVLEIVERVDVLEHGRKVLRDSGDLRPLRKTKRAAAGGSRGLWEFWEDWDFWEECGRYINPSLPRVPMRAARFAYISK